MYLMNGLTLKNVVVVPDFQHSLLSVKRLIDSKNCKINFYAGWCIIFHNESGGVKELGASKDGLYYVLNQNINSVVGEMKHCANTALKVTNGCIESEKVSNAFVWHLILGHVPFEKLHHVSRLKICVSHVLWAKSPNNPFTLINPMLYNHLNSYSHRCMGTI